MANTITPLVDKLIARGLEVLRENAVMPRLVNSTYSNVARNRGDTITVPVAADITASSVSPSAIPRCRARPSRSTSGIKPVSI
jgi:hypothetical protein